MQIFFDDLALPHLIAHAARRDARDARATAPASSSDGTPTNLHVVRSMRGALGRRIALGGELARELRELEAAARRLLEAPAATTAARGRDARSTRSQRCARACARIPFLDPIDLRYRNRVRCRCRPRKAVMFCLMDVSGSMDEARKDLAKRFFILLYLFLTRHYEKIDLVFIRHHTQAQEVDEDELLPRPRDRRHRRVAARWC